MTGALFDTTMVIDYLDGDKKAQAAFAQYPHRSISVVTWIEVMAAAPDDMHEHTRHFLRSFERLAMNEAIADRAFVLMQTHREQSLRRLIPWATAQANALLFVTADPPRTLSEDAGVLVPYRSRRGK